MKPLTGKQKRYLRSLANGLNATFQIGKEGLSENLATGIGQALKAHELIKVSILKNCEGDLKEVAFDLAAMTESSLVQVIGRTVVLYKPSKEGKIILP